MAGSDANNLTFYHFMAIRKGSKQETKLIQEKELKLAAPHYQVY
jgi:hypothetical protein